MLLKSSSNSPRFCLRSPTGASQSDWNKAEASEMQPTTRLYGKTYQFWPEPGDEAPMGKPRLMGSFTSDVAVAKAFPGGIEQLVEELNSKFGVSIKDKAESRKGFGKDVEIHPGM
jgi:hypothetical protein